jgi:hypothetical protein
VQEETVERQAEQHRRDAGDGAGQPEVEPVRDQCQPDVRAEQVERGLRKVEDPHQPEDQRQAGGDEK